jgi:hypothetical protein
MTVDWGDAPAWAALGISVVGTIVAVSSAKSSRASARSAEISAQAGVRQAAAAEEQVAIARRTLRLAEEGKTIPSPPPAGERPEGSTQDPPYVAWWIESEGTNLFVLRNIGTATARSVEIDESRDGYTIQGRLKIQEVLPGQGVRLKLSYWWPWQRPDQLWVRWQGHPDWKGVQLP